VVIRSVFIVINCYIWHFLFIASVDKPKPQFSFFTIGNNTINET